MKIISNEKLINRNKKITQYLTFGSLGILGIGLVVSFQEAYMIWSLPALIVGFILSQIGIFMTSKWGRSPRPDESISMALKGLDNKFTLFHHETVVSHLLVGPAGLWIFLPYYQAGTISYDESKKRWKQKGGNWYLKIFAQENLGRPDLEVQSVNKDITKFLSKHLNEDIPEIHIALVFTNEEVVLESENAPIPTLHAKKLKDFIRKKSKENLLSAEETAKLVELFS
ncbi:MAG: hypothetical protein JEZ06_21310 [Anaerolineaceae bacterium]|nr:hypothetical protein [Anaerolineaceae bacterium]